MASDKMLQRLSSLRNFGVSSNACCHIQGNTGLQDLALKQKIAISLHATEFWTLYHCNIQWQWQFVNLLRTRVVWITDENGGVRFCPKLAKQKPPRIGNLFEESSFLTPVIYALLGVLAGLLLIGTLWDIIRKKRRINENTASGENREITRSNMRAYFFFFFFFCGLILLNE